MKKKYPIYPSHEEIDMIEKRSLKNILKYLNSTRGWKLRDGTSRSFRFTGRRWRHIKHVCGMQTLYLPGIDWRDDKTCIQEFYSKEELIARLRANVGKRYYGDYRDSVTPEPIEVVEKPKKKYIKKKSSYQPQVSEWDDDDTPLFEDWDNPLYRYNEYDLFMMSECSMDVDLAKIPLIEDFDLNEYFRYP